MNKVYRLHYKMFLCFCLPVPQPTVVIRRSHNGLIHAGSDFILNAEISFDDPMVVDVSISLTISWSRDGDIITSNKHISLSPTIVSESGYTVSLTYSPITTSDSGLITATVTVSPSDDSMYIKSVTATETHTINVEGIHFITTFIIIMTVKEYVLIVLLYVFTFLTYITMYIHVMYTYRATGFNLTISRF